MDENWRPLIPGLVKAYLRWKHDGPQHVSAADGSSSENPSGATYDFDIDVLDIYSLASSAHISRAPTIEYTAEALMLNGYLGSSPFSPSLAISVKTLDLLRCLRLYKPSFSMEAYTKLLCHQYMIPFHRRYRTALADAFDVYLTVLRNVRHQVLGALGRDTLNWRVLNACPPCGYELEGEPPLKFSRMYCIDGNNSLKRLAPVGNRKAGDQRNFTETDYYLPVDFVEKYAHEVRSRQIPEKIAGMRAAGNPSADNGDPTDGGEDGNSACTTNWKAAAAEEKKRMWGVFEETGIFASACRHGLILWLIDMVRSGELAKYPLAIVAKVHEVLGARTLCGYDIGCSFQKTIRASFLGPDFARLESRCCVNAFHGYSHAYSCQTRHHPNVIEGMGIEDLETLERVFSSSNQLAGVTCYASAYRRRIFIDMFFQQWDDDKYANLGTMPYNNYVQALDIINTKGLALADALQSLGISLGDLKTFGEEEDQYFQTVGDETPWDVHAMAYVELLQELRDVRTQLDSVSGRFLNTAPNNYEFLPPLSGPTVYETDLSQTQRLETQRRTLSERYNTLLQDVVATEVRLGIQARWQPSDPPYAETVKYISTRKYQQALGKLQKLVIQRLFELHKLNLSQTVRTHIAKSLQTRCKAIRNAVNAYNTAASALVPPRPTLDWTKVSHYGFLEEFDLLQDTRADIRDKPWARPAVRETMKLTRRIERAHEEIVRCNVEVRRLHTAIRDEDMLFGAVLEDLQRRRDILYGPVHEFCVRRRGLNAHVLACINRIYALDGFTGDPSPGQRVGASLPAIVRPSELERSLSVEGRELDLELREGLDLDDEDEDTGDLGGLVEYLANLAV
ncbi:hypothetical protein B0H21DRAFT_699872 [Amylocystis lapponica]|nr:hypothetical protein B0H21DRAFT_699872 [Amylocystis lapponica]